MRKLIKKIIIAIILIPLEINAETILSSGTPYGTYEDAQKMIKEVMKAYYNRGSYIQYNYAKATYGLESPEEATSQDIRYNVCAAYTYDVLTETFGLTYKLNETETSFPRYANDILKRGKYLYESNDNKELIYYENTSNNTYYVKGYSGTEDISFNEFVKKLKPGDLLSFSHAMMVYDVVDRNNDGEVDDALLLASSGHSKVNSRIGENDIYLYYDKIINKSNGVINTPPYGNNSGGGIYWQWLSNNGNFVNQDSEKIKCNKTECAIIRLFYEDTNKNAVFNYTIDTEQYKKAKLRTEYPDIFIEKTVNIGDNNSVYIGNSLTYTINITNKSSLSYGNFKIEETIGDNVKYVSSEGESTYNETTNTITWNISGLAAGDSKTLSYTVNVKEISFEPVKATGKLYKNNNQIYITTGTVSNPVVIHFAIKQSYLYCYNENKDNYSSFELIDKIIECARPDTESNMLQNIFNISNPFEEYIYDKIDTTNKNQANRILLKNDNNNVKKIKKMLLNNYWSGLVKIKNTDKLILSRWSIYDDPARAKTINPSDFEDGDILIYSVGENSSTAENGIYVYVYIQSLGGFIGKNYTESSNVRDKFTYDYYSDINSLFTENTTFGPYKKDSDDYNEDDKIFMNYQTLFDKDFYIILRPSILNLKLKTTKYNLDDDNKIIYGIPINTDINTISSNFNTTGDISITNNENISITNNISTGNTFKVTFSTNRSLEYIISIKGDVEGDGIINSNDVIKAYNILMKKITVTKLYQDTADTTNDGELKINDIAKLYQYTKGIINSLD
ncbi:MAG: DUF11 domain-containing protein [Bacilli bacterium]|nr:DUF11 domain-containing protein [Bacilli bacterium]